MTSPVDRATTITDAPRFRGRSGESPVIRRVTEPPELLRVFQFRYRVYVEEMGKFQKYADHQLKMVQEPLDRTATILAAYRGDDILGTIRTNHVRDGVGEYWDFNRMEEFDHAILERAVVTTKLLVARDVRESIAGLGVSLATTGFRLAYESGVRYSFCDCNPVPRDIERFFLKLGYRRIMPRFVHPEYGPSTSLFMCCSDIEHLRRLRSPFAQIVEECGTDPDSVEKFHRWFEKWKARFSNAPSVLDLCRTTPHHPSSN
jgi:hypothetical protein